MAAKEIIKVCHYSFGDITAAHAVISTHSHLVTIQLCFNKANCNHKVISQAS